MYEFDFKGKDYTFHVSYRNMGLRPEDDLLFDLPRAVHVYRMSSLIDAVNALLYKTGQNIFIESYEEDDTSGE